VNAGDSKGYDLEADALVRRYEQASPLEKYQPALHLLPLAPSRVMDVGAGSGVDAAWLASLGHEVVAVEPAIEMRRRAIALHDSPRIRWIDDSLPRLRSVARLGETFELIVVAGVWTHLDEGERRESMRTMASLLSPGGILVLSVRQGPAPAGRRTFPVASHETAASAESRGLEKVLDVEAQSLQPANRAAGVKWNWLAFRRAEPRR
jgi:2-polyprenyl-3-methyl-5-hydroxy-6-metoxy-1,4-benzoquinol methylase